MKIFHMRVRLYLKPNSQEEVFKRYIAKLQHTPVTVVLFGSRARGEATPFSDYDLLVIRASPDIPVKPWEVEPGLYATIVTTTPEQLEPLMYQNSLLLAAILEGKIILDNLTRIKFPKLRK